MAHSKSDRIRIHLRGKRKLGLVKRDSTQDESDFVDQCVSNMTENGEMSEDDATEMCENMWEEQEGSDD